MSLSTPISRAKEASRFLNSQIYPALDIVILLDGSGSMRSQFPVAQACIRALVAKLPMLNGERTIVRVAVVLYTSTARDIVGVFTADKSHVCAAIGGITHRGGTTNLKVALEAAKAKFQKHARAGASKMIIVLTDDDVEAGLSVASGLTDISLMCFSIGNFSADKQARIKGMSTNGCGFFHKNLMEAQDFISAIDLFENGAPTLAVVARSSVSVCFQVDVPKENGLGYTGVLIRVREAGRVDRLVAEVEIPHARLEEDVCAVVVNGLNPNVHYTATAWGRRGDKALSEPSIAFEFRTMARHRDCELFKDKAKLLVAVQDMKEEIMAAEIPCEWPGINMIILGPIGQGKSSFINSLSKLFTGQYLERADTGVQLTTVTKELRPFRVIPRQCESSPKPIFIWDFYGEEQGVHEYAGILPFILDGDVKRYKLGDKVNKETVNTTHTDLPPIKRRMQVVFIAFSAQSCLLESDMNHMRKLVHQLLDKGYSPIVLLTKLDGIDACSHLASDCTDVHELENVDYFMDLLSKGANIPRANIFPVVNILSNDEQYSAAKECLLLRVLSEGIRRAQVKIYDWQDEIDEGCGPAYYASVQSAQSSALGASPSGGGSIPGVCQPPVDAAALSLVLACDSAAQLVSLTHVSLFELMVVARKTFGLDCTPNFFRLDSRNQEEQLVSDDQLVKLNNYDRVIVKLPLSGREGSSGPRSASEGIEHRRRQ